MYFAHIVAYYWHKYLTTAEPDRRDYYGRKYEDYVSAMCDWHGFVYVSTW